MRYAVLVVGLLLFVGVGCADYWQTTDLNICPDVVVQEAKYDGNDVLHFLYIKYVDDEIFYGLRNTSGVYTQQIATGDRVGYGDFQLCVDSSNQVHVAFTSGPSLYYGKRYIDGSWSSFTPVYNYVHNSYFEWDIATDVDDNPYIVTREDYATGYPNRYWNVSVWYLDEGDWVSDTVYATPTTGYGAHDPCLLITPTGTMYVSYKNATDPYPFMVATGSIGGWTHYVVDQHSCGADISGFLDSDAHPHFFYENSYAYGGNPKHAWNSGTGWQTEIAGLDTSWIEGLNGFCAPDNTIFRVCAVGNTYTGPVVWKKEEGGIWEKIRDDTTTQISYPIYGAVASNNLPTIFYMDQPQDRLYLLDYIHTAGSCVNVTGDVYYYNATKVGSGVTVAIQQDGEYYNTTTNSTGGYSQIELETDKELLIWPEKAGYNSTPINFTPLDCAIRYIADLVLIPDDLDFNSSAIGGIVYQKPFYEIDGGLTVSITNGTWSSSNITNNVGFYLFTDLEGGEEYTLTASAPKHESQSVNVTAIVGNFTQQDFILNESFTLTVQLKNLDTGGLINDREVSVTLSSGASQKTTDGGAEFTNLTYQYYSIDSFAEGYYPGSGSTILDDDQTVIVYMQERSDTSGSGINYEEHDVRFIVTNEFGMPISGATVTAIAINSTTPWDWLNSWFGISTAVNIQNTTLSGFTGSEGSVVFPMVKSVNYQIDISKPSAGISHSVNVMPQESTYTVRVNTGLLPNVGGGYPRFSLDATENGSYVDLTMTYNDASNQTSAITFTVKDDDGNVVYQTNPTLSGGAASATFSVENVRGTSRTFGFNASHTTHGEIQNWQGIDLKGTGRLIDLGFSDPLIYVWISLAIIFIFAGAVGETDVKIGAFLVPILGGGTFWYIGWLPASLGLVIAIGASLGGVYYMRASESKVKS